MGSTGSLFSSIHVNLMDSKKNIKIFYDFKIKVKSNYLINIFKNIHDHIYLFKCIKNTQKITQINN